jgi:hypothetical protein
MKIIKKLLRSFFILFIILLVSFPLWVGKIPLKYLSFFIGKTAVSDHYICKYPVKISGDSMAPLIPQGTTITLDRCFSQSDLSVGTVVLYDKNSESHLAVIRHVLNLDPLVYKISNEQSNQRLIDVIISEIVAVSNDFDINNSSYQSTTDPDSFIINPKEYVSKLYLGKIPRGYGVEMAQVEETNIFHQDTDKFCLVVTPKKELAFVDTEIIDTKTQKIVKLSKNIVFNVSSKSNINCQDFGTDSDALNLPVGNYRYRFLLNHQVLADIQFEIM